MMTYGWRGVVAVLTVAAAALSGCSLLPPGVSARPTPGVPNTPLPTLDATDSERRAGNWNLIHRVDVPQGWTLSQVQVSGGAELSDWRRVGDELTSLCGVSVWEDFADFTPQPSGGVPVEVRGRPGLFLGKPDSNEALSGLWWHYLPDAWASLDCEDDLGRDELVALAERVTFRPTKVLLPFRLTAVPEGFDVTYLGWDQVTGPPVFQLALRGRGDEEFPQPPGIEMTRISAASPASTGGERVTVGGRAARLDLQARTLCFALDGWQACVEGHSDSDPPEPDGDAQLRARLLAVGNVLDFAPDLENAASWFDGNSAAAA